ncbi:Iron-sulfur cluster assembly 1-like, mitochondrial [Hondaea fermentalgiana]|uniref:Iron-sulfur cluster assembly 1-like, mitochondrial n=1 Tax=Hondaea fermentalgiana TaxID=2315210 RepID=A0A2R5GIK5_9STRA|nr:Iron-sulfur cluster assembly 1-like, mitochondrial [Hondaea fermentalgiana]|eukprot:GBG27704.1 Iron-sulfur cluster assembly 1-like, mitochondrial [Hondaea fermentalgiana]
MLAAARRSGLGMARVGSPLWRAAFSTSGVTEDGAGVLLTKKGAERLLELQKSKNNDKLMLRLAVEGGGCSGFSYVFNVTDEEPNDDDIIFEHHGQKVVVDDVSLDLVRGSKIDFTEDLIRRSFEVVDNPNAETGCGCGSSFAAKMEF